MRHRGRPTTDDDDDDDDDLVVFLSRPSSDLLSSFRRRRRRGGRGAAGGGWRGKWDARVALGWIFHVIWNQDSRLFPVFVIFCVGLSWSVVVGDF